MSIHAHRREGASGQKELAQALLITLSVMVVELVAGLMSHSLALLADAGHMLTDAFALSLGLFAAWMASRPATPEKTFGYYRTEILAALINGVALWLIVIWIYVRAWARLSNPEQIFTGPMLVAACVGLIANISSGLVLSRAQSTSLNVRGAWLHVVGDALGSCGVITAGLLIRFKGWVLADPMVSMFIGLLIALSSWVLIRRAVNILLEGAPAHLNLTRITERMRHVPGVHEVHDVHLWTITTGLEAMSGHIIVESLAQGPAILTELNQVLSEEFGIHHTTFQLEPHDHRCEATREPSSQ